MTAVTRPRGNVHKRRNVIAECDRLQCFQPACRLAKFAIVKFLFTIALDNRSGISNQSRC